MNNEISLENRQDEFIEDYLTETDIYERVQVRKPFDRNSFCIRNNLKKSFDIFYSNYNQSLLNLGRITTIR